MYLLRLERRKDSAMCCVKVEEVAERSVDGKGEELVEGMKASFLNILCVGIVLPDL
jgi:hypothetical protein